VIEKEPSSAPARRQLGLVSRGILIWRAGRRREWQRWWTEIGTTGSRRLLAGVFFESRLPARSQGLSREAGSGVGGNSPLNEAASCDVIMFTRSYASGLGLSHQNVRVGAGIRILGPFRPGV